MNHCIHCQGTGRNQTLEPQMAKGTVYVDPVTGYAKWPCDGGVPQRVDYPTGRFIRLIETCVECNGTGLPITTEPTTAKAS